MAESGKDSDVSKDTPEPGNTASRKPELMAKLEELGVAGSARSRYDVNPASVPKWKSRFVLVPTLIFVALGTLLWFADSPDTVENGPQELAANSPRPTGYAYGVPPGVSTGARPGIPAGQGVPRVGPSTPPAPNWRPVSPQVRPPAMSGSGVVPNRAMPKDRGRYSAPPSPGQIPYFYQYPRNVVPYNRYTPYPPPYSARPAPGFGAYPHGYYYPPPPPRYSVPQSPTARDSSVPFGDPSR